MQLQIEKLVNRLYGLYPGFGYYREGPCHTEVKFDVLLKNEQKGLYIKAFLDNEFGRVSYMKELRRIQIFNEFSKDEKLKFSGPEIIQYDDENLLFVMKDIEFNGKKLLNFRSLSKEEAVNHFYQYRKVFESFEAYCLDNGYSLVNIDDSYSVTKLIEKCKKWYFEGEAVAKENNVLIDFQSIESKIIELFNNYGRQLLPRELSFKWFWTGHVFESNGEYQLVDFDIIGYEIKGKSFCRLACYCVLLSVDNYDFYEKRKFDFEWWIREMLKTNEKLVVDILVLSSLVGILYADYGGTMVTEDYNRKLVDGKGVTPEENAKKGMQRCAKLLEELYDIK